MAIEHASNAQILAVRDNAEKVRVALQQLVQGSYRAAKASATEKTRLNTLIGNLNTAVDAVIAAAIDSTPSAFSFTDVTGASTNSVYISNEITVAGITESAAPAISVSGGLYSINGGPFVSAAGTVKLGDKVRARAVSSDTASTAVNVAVTIGGVSDTFTVTTA